LFEPSLTGGFVRYGQTIKFFFRNQKKFYINRELLGGGKSIIAEVKFGGRLITNFVGADLDKIDAAVVEYFKDQPL